jgi:serine/threonine protein kinase
MLAQSRSSYLPIEAASHVTVSSHARIFEHTAPQVGTPLWMAPEIFTGTVSSYGPAVDVYSYGIIMWELATRSRPWAELDDSSYIAFRGALTEALMAGQRPALPDGIEADHPIFVKVMRKAWATDPNERPSFSHIVFSLEMIEIQSTSSSVSSTSLKRNTTSSTGGNMDSLTEPLLPPE